MQLVACGWVCTVVSACNVVGHGILVYKILRGYDKC